MFEDIEPAAKPKAPKPLDDMSIAGLEEYIAALKGEIVRVEAAIRAKQSHAETAASFFKKP